MLSLDHTLISGVASCCKPIYNIHIHKSDLNLLGQSFFTSKMFLHTVISSFILSVSCTYVV